MWCEDATPRTAESSGLPITHSTHTNWILPRQTVLLLSELFHLIRAVLGAPPQPHFSNSLSKMKHQNRFKNLKLAGQNLNTFERWSTVAFQRLSNKQNKFWLQFLRSQDPQCKAEVSIIRNYIYWVLSSFRKIMVWPEVITVNKYI